MVAAVPVIAEAPTAEMIGTIQWVLEAVTKFTAIREQTGQVIEVFQDISARCAALQDAVENCRWALYSAVTALQQEKAGAADAVSLARELTAETFAKLSSLLLQRQEGMGLTWEHDLHLFRSIPPFFNSIF